VVGQRLALGVGAQNRLATVAVRWGDQHLAVEAARWQQRFVGLVDVVGGGDDDHRARVALESVELDQQLIERLLALTRATIAASTTARSTDGIELVDEDHGAS